MKNPMHKIFGLLTVLSFAFTGIKAQQPYFDIKLWEKGLPNSNGNDSGGYDLQDKSYKPIIRVFLPEKEKATGRAIVCYPGGGYAQTQPEHYANDWAPFYNEQGIALIVLHYRVPKGYAEVPISDALEAYNQTKVHAKEWHINPNDIGIQGLSAGGHLATTVTTHFQDHVQAAFQILIYPVITFDGPDTHTGSRSNLIGHAPVLKTNATTTEKAAFEKRNAIYNQLKDHYSNEKHVTSHTPRTFIAVSDDDRLAMNSVLYYTALHQNQVPAVLHTYPSGGHGWHVHVQNNRFLYSPLVEQELKAWLASF
jgi:Esterase/lipase